MIRAARSGVEIGRTWVRPLRRMGRLGLARLWKALALLLDEEDGFFGMVSLTRYPRRSRDMISNRPIQAALGHPGGGGEVVVRPRPRPRLVAAFRRRASPPDASVPAPPRRFPVTQRRNIRPVAKFSSARRPGALARIPPASSPHGSPVKIA